MESFLSNPTINKADLAVINRCRLYLKAFSLADITSGDGKSISKAAWEGTSSSSFRDTEHWPMWAKPNKFEWRMWQHALMTTFTNTSNKELNEPLKHWINKPTSTWYTESDNLALWKFDRDINSWTEFK